MDERTIYPEDFSGPDQAGCVQQPTPQNDPSSPPPVKLGKTRLLKILLAIGAASVLVLTLFFALRCDHQWEEATCLGPKTCSLCGKTVGEPLDHIWDEATCLHPKACSFCGTEEGAPLSHTPGEWVTVCESLIDRTVTHTRKCLECGAIVDEEQEIVDTFVKDGRFIFNDDLFLENYLHLLTERTGLDFSVEVCGSEPTEYWPGPIERQYRIFLSGEPWGDLEFDYSHADDPTLSEIHGRVHFLNSTDTLINYTILSYLMMAVDPTLSADDAVVMLQELSVQIQESYAEGYPGLTYSGKGSYVHNGIIYEQIGTDFPGFMSTLALDIRPAN